MVAKKSFLLLGGLVSITLLGSSLPSLGEELLKLKWGRYVGKENYALTNQPLIWKNRIYHASSGDFDGSDSYDRFYAFGKNGNPLWSFKWNNDLNGVVANDKFVTFSSDDGWVFVFDHSGNLLWKKEVSNSWKIIALSTADLNGDGYPDLLLGSYEYLYALNGENGSLLWKFKTGGWVDSSPAIADIDGDSKPEVVFGSEDNYLYALNGENGFLLWKFKTGGWIDSSPAIADIDGDGKLEVVFGSNDNYLYALNSESGLLLWKFETGGYVKSSPAIADIDGDGKLEVVFGSNDNYLYALNGEDGSLLWKFETDGEIRSSPAIADIDGDGKLEVVFGGCDKYLYVLKGKDGSLLWKFETGGAICSSPAIGDVDGDGRIDIVVASQDGKLYLFESTKIGGKVVWSRWHGDAQGTGYYQNALKFAENNLKGGLKISHSRLLTKTLKFIKLAKQPYYALGIAKFTSEKNQNIIKIARIKAIKVAQKELFKKLKPQVEEIGNGLLSEAGISDPSIKQQLLSQLLKEVRNKIANLKPVDELVTENKVYILLNGGKLIKFATKKGGEILVALLEKKTLEPYTVTVSVKPSPSLGDKCVPANPNRYLFAVGVGYYDAVSPIPYALNDVELIQKVATCFMGVPKTNIVVLKNPTVGEIYSQLKRFVRNIKRPDSVVYFYYSGHGVTDQDGNFYLLPKDADISDQELLKFTAISLAGLDSILSIANGKKVVILDACRVKVNWKPAILVKKIIAPNKAILFGTRAGQTSNKAKNADYSAFTYALYKMASEGLKNLDFNSDGYIEVKELLPALKARVRELSSDPNQIPDFMGDDRVPLFEVP